jgi:magnesium-transporting ATPase (P-type)
MSRNRTCRHTRLALNKIFTGRFNDIDTGKQMNANGKKTAHLFTLNNIFLVFCLILFSVFLINTYQMKDASSYMLPRMLCIFGIVIIGIMIISAVFKVDSVKTPKNEAPAQKAGLKIGYSIAFAVAYFFMTNLLGFILATGLAIIAFSYLMGYQNKKIIVLLSVIIPLILHLAFVTLLKSSLPSGLVENLLF